MQSGTTRNPGQEERESATGSAFVFGVRVDCLSMEDVLDRVGRAIDGGDPLTITGPHFSILLQAYRDQHLKAFLNGCSINHPDGVGTALAVRFLHGVRCNRLNGTDLYQAILRQYPPNVYRYFFLGGDETTIRCLRETFSRMGFTAGMYDAHEGGVGIDDPGIAERIRRFRPAILFVGLGSPKQFAWIERWSDTLGVPVIVAVGAGLEFLSGRRRRAPRWMRVVGLEWVHRLCLEPVRLWKRYLLGIPRFLFLLMRERTSARRTRR